MADLSRVGKVQASLTSLTQETTVALANASFDLSIIKLEVPAEYKALGSALSRTRREAAEDGEPHRVARRLGSLFSSIIPKTPDLLKAYGKRTSELSSMLQADTKSAKVLGAFQDFVGFDGTSIWAAATSGLEAIAVHLLACMLARSFRKQDESLAIWIELVKERKARLAPDDAQFTPIEDIAAAQLEVTDQQLANWDASARAWLQAADSVPAFVKRQKQVTLILDNISYSVNNIGTVYESVCAAWATATHDYEFHYSWRSL